MNYNQLILFLKIRWYKRKKKCPFCRSKDFIYNDEIMLHVLIAKQGKKPFNNKNLIKNNPEEKPEDAWCITKPFRSITCGKCGYTYFFEGYYSESLEEDDVKL